MDYLQMRSKWLCHSSFVENEIKREKARLNPVNKDFYQDLPYFVTDILNSLTWTYGECEWFKEAWEKYRKHILDAGIGGSYKMPGFVFNSYIEKEIKKRNEKMIKGEEVKYSYPEEDADEYIAHHGIKGQRWGIRRYQNEDGTLTADGKVRRDREHYQKAAGAGVGALIGATFGLGTALKYRLPTKRNLKTVSFNKNLSKSAIVARTVGGAIVGSLVGKKIADIRANKQRAREWDQFQQVAVENQLKVNK